MKIYYWENNGDTEFNTHDLMILEREYSTSGQHSGGIVVMAESSERAVELAMFDLGLTSEEVRTYLSGTITEFDKEEGVIFWGNGDC